jgi:hypothetical protein
MPLILSGTDGVQSNSGAFIRDTANGGGTTPFPSTGGPTAVNYTTTVPSWAKRITVVFGGVSTSGTSVKQVQIGSGSIVTSGYVNVGGTFYSTNISGATSFTSGFVINSNAAGDVLNGIMTLTNVNGNIWVANGLFANAVSTPQVFTSNGSLTLGGALDRVRITTFNGTDLFDAGTINLLYE